MGVAICLTGITCHLHVIFDNKHIEKKYWCGTLIWGSARNPHFVECNTTRR